ncbi:molybdopterin-dependent oxidoreductase [Haloechinothrix salitolerans]|uniref:Molybdopterin-dependent oxidoreductase n=1 Tax=Haloechinothrix salitolerans TaxID=926830 RepID=A0ABW2C7Z8_9PSEU
MDTPPEQPGRASAGPDDGARRADADASTAPDGARLPLGTAVLVVVLALFAALTAGHLVAAVVGPGASPLVAVGNSVIDLAPSWLVEFGKDVFGTKNKLVLLLGIGLALVLLGVATGAASRRKAAPGVGLIAALGAVGIAAVVTRTELGQLAVAAPIVGLLVGIVVFPWLHRLARETYVDSSGNAGGADDVRTVRTGADARLTDASRRRFIGSSLGVAAGAGVAGLTGQAFAGPDVQASRADIAPFQPKTTAPPIPKGADFAANGTPTLITPNRDFYTIHTALVVPRVPVDDWTLRIHGMVDRPLTLTYDELRQRPLVERTLTLACVSNPVGGRLISTANFIGVDLRDLLQEAGVKPGAEQLYSTSHDGFTAGTPVDVVMEPDRRAMLALGMNGEPLPVSHGFPVRMVVPGLYGFVSATKWLVDLELTTWDAKQGYWQPRGWAREAPVKTQSRIDGPLGDITAGDVVVAGTAWAPHVGIDAVEVRVDDGPWQRAELSTEVSVDTWRMWRATVRMSRGENTVTCRATDRTGATQPEVETPVAPDGATGWHSVTFTAR